MNKQFMVNNSKNRFFQDEVAYKAMTDKRGASVLPLRNVIHPKTSSQGKFAEFYSIMIPRASVMDEVYDIMN